MEIHGISPMGLVTLLLMKMGNICWCYLQGPHNLVIWKEKFFFKWRNFRDMSLQSLLSVAFLINIRVKYKLNQGLQEPRYSRVLLQIELKVLRYLSKNCMKEELYSCQVSGHYISPDIERRQAPAPDWLSNLIKKLVHHSLYSRVVVKLRPTFVYGTIKNWIPKRVH